MAKVSFKDLLLEKGDKFALIGGGVLAGAFALYGLVQVAGAGSPAAKAKEFASASEQVKSRVRQEGQPAAELPKWVTKSNEFIKVDPRKFDLAGPPFEAASRPDLTRQNPRVLGIVNAQYNVLTYPVRANDIIEVGDSIKVGVLRTVTAKGADARELNQATSQQLNKFKDGLKFRGGDYLSYLRNKQLRENQEKREKNGGQLPGVPGGQPGGPGGGSSGGPGGGFSGGPGGGSSGGPGGGFSGGPGGGFSGGPGGPGGGFGGSGGLGGGRGGGPGGYGGGLGGTATSRTDTTTEYVDPDKIEGRTLAQTILPLRAVCVTAAFPLKQQIEEVRLALRLRTTEEAIQQSSTPTQQGPVFDGFDVQRRQLAPGGKAYSEYIQLPILTIYATKIANRVLQNSPDDAYVAAYFNRIGQKMVSPIPEPVDGLGTYPQIRLPEIEAGVKKLKDLAVTPPTQSELEKILRGTVGEGVDPFAPSFGAAAAGGAAGGPPGIGSGRSGGAGSSGGGLGGLGGLGGAGRPPGSSGSSGGPGGPGNTLQTVAPSVDYTLLRFLDTEVEPGFTYQYRVSVRMLNPNSDKRRANTASDTEEKILNGPYVEIPAPITLPPELHIFAEASQKYIEKADEMVKEYRSSPQLKKALEVEEVEIGREVVVQVQRWMENLLIGGSTGQKEPVGTWVVSDVPVGPGEYIGKRQLVELPLWSSGQEAYVLRQTTGGTKIRDVKLKGWPINFRTPLVLIDFEGGKVTTRSEGRNLTDDADAELLILHPDGSLQVRNSAVDARDNERAEREKTWTDWLQKVRSRPETLPGGVPGGPGGPGGSSQPGGS